MRRALFPLAGWLFIAASLHAAESPAWTGKWEAPELPTRSMPPWIYFKGGEIQQTGDLLNIESTLKDTTACFRLVSDPSYWQVSENGVTVEVEMRVNSMVGTMGAAVVLAGFGPERDLAYFVAFGLDWVQLGGNKANRASIEPGTFHVFRITADESGATLFLDGDPSQALFLGAEHRTKASYDTLLFGDPSSYGGGNADWKSIRWTDAEMVVP